MMKSLLTVAMLFLAGTLACASAQAQTGTSRAAPPEPPKPPKAQKADEPNTFMNIAGMVIMAGAVLGASVIPSRRGHQD